MIQFIKTILSKVIIFFTRVSGINNIIKSLALININQIYSLEKFSSKKNLLRFGFKIFSQQDEDGIIEEIFKRIKIKNKNFLEIGVETGIESNTTYLLIQGWNGLWIEGKKSLFKDIVNNFSKYLVNKDLKVSINKVYPENINNILEKYYKPNEEIDLLSIDIGCHTYHVLKELDYINPRVVVTEYNAKYGPSIMWEVNYIKNMNWDYSDYFGASLNSFVNVMKKKGYSLVVCNVTGVNAFFIRNDLISDNFDNNFDSQDHFLEGRYWLKSAFSSNYKININS